MVYLLGDLVSLTFLRTFTLKQIWLSEAGTVAKTPYCCMYYMLSYKNV